MYKASRSVPYKSKFDLTNDEQSSDYFCDYFLDLSRSVMCILNFSPPTATQYLLVILFAYETTFGFCLVNHQNHKNDLVISNSRSLTIPFHFCCDLPVHPSKPRAL